MAVLTEEQSMLRDAARAWTQEKSPVTAFRKLRDSKSELGFDASVWSEMGQMGWAGVIVPEAYGGSDFGYVGLGLVLEETGRTLTASPLLSTALVGASALVLGGSEAQKQAWLPRLASGEAIATLAVDEGPHHHPEQTALSAEKTSTGYSLSGSKTFVLEGMAADLIVVAARTSGSPGETAGITLFLVEGTANGLTRKALHLADSRGHAQLTFHNVEVGSDAVLGSVDSGWDLLDQILDRARAGLAAEMLGASAQAFETTLDYLKTRTQFGQLIGSFQALQHRAAKMYTEIELSRSAVEAALQAIDDRANNVPELVSLAKARIGDTLHLVSNEMVQMHGGIGMTDAHDAGFYLKRARVCEAAFGGQSYHRDRYARIHGY
ncbi:MAG TPA: acyl-CoA dehydrogenase family protein [Caulobacteraceae bacterium]|nr:acyl-CoA dehydrogenase family protein [Caulobacteraceae bacterium]